MNSKNINKKTLYIWDLTVLLVTIFIDRFSKYFVEIKLKGHPSYPLIGNILELRYLENPGAAFGLLKNQKYFFILVASIVLLTIVYVIIKTPAKCKYISMHIFLVLIGSGAISNSVDRLLYGYVIDFVYFSVINFPIFNIADVFITVSTVLLILFLVFGFKEDDLNFLRFKEKKIRDIN